MAMPIPCETPDLDPTRCYAALRSRDARFDGRFFVGVRTTGIFCRPVCPARTPKLANVRFFACAAAAQAEGFRPCKRCRPETSPGTPAWLGSSATVSRALRLIAEGGLDEAPVDAFAARLGVGDRQLRRLFARHLGASPAEIARARRVHFARRLIDETRLPMTEVAFSSGFRSIRDFNFAVRGTFGRSPRELRRGRTPRAGVRGGEGEGELVVRLPYRPPLDYAGVLAFLRLRAIPGVEWVGDDRYRRTLAQDGAAGAIELRALDGEDQLEMRVCLPAYDGLIRIVERARCIFDLGADPLQISSALRRSPLLAARVRRAPGLRVPGAWDAFELAVRAVLGQQVSVKGATTLAGRLVRGFGRPVEGLGEGLTHLFPAPEALAEADLARIGIPAARAETLRTLARAVAAGSLRLDAAQGLDEAVARLVAIPGIGAWTAHYVAMRALGEPDAFPASDLGLRRALASGGIAPSTRELERLAEAWRPWRAYAAVALWTSPAPATKEKT
jgi:AraC family transcriptional regulator of adaptative response / DNA-3-methyladenine glycosylase II